MSLKNLSSLCCQELIEKTCLRVKLKPGDHQLSSAERLKAEILESWRSPETPGIHPRCGSCEDGNLLDWQEVQIDFITRRWKNKQAALPQWCSELQEDTGLIMDWFHRCLLCSFPCFLPAPAALFAASPGPGHTQWLLIVFFWLNVCVSPASTSRTMERLQMDIGRVIVFHHVLFGETVRGTD